MYHLKFTLTLFLFIFTISVFVIISCSKNDGVKQLTDPSLIKINLESATAVGGIVISGINARINIPGMALNELNRMMSMAQKDTTINCSKSGNIHITVLNDTTIYEYNNCIDGCIDPDTTDSIGVICQTAFYNGIMKVKEVKTNDSTFIYIVAKNLEFRQSDSDCGLSISANGEFGLNAKNSSTIIFINGFIETNYFRLVGENFRCYIYGENSDSSNATINGGIALTNKDDSLHNHYAKYYNFNISKKSIRIDNRNTNQIKMSGRLTNSDCINGWGEIRTLTSLILPSESSCPISGSIKIIGDGSAIMTFRNDGSVEIDIDGNKTIKNNCKELSCK